MSDAHRILHPSRRARLAAFAVALALLAVSAVVWLSPSTAEPSAAPTQSPQEKALEAENASLKAALAARTDQVGDLTRSQQKAAAERAAGAATGKQRAQLDHEEAIAQGQAKAASERARAASSGTAKARAEKAAAAAIGRAQAADARAAAAAIAAAAAKKSTPPAPASSPPPAPAKVTAPSLASLLAPTKRQFGLYTTQSPFNWAELDNVSATVGVKPTIAGYFQGWDGPFRADAVERSWTKGMLPLLTWESRPLKAGNDQAVDPNYSLPKIINGQYDAYLHQYARDIAALGLPLAIRLDHEMNGSWYPWGERTYSGNALNGNRPGDYVKMWRHVHDIFAAEGANAYVIWVWAPNIVNALPSYAKSSSWYMKSLYPGDDYVDWVGLSGYYRPPYKADQTPTFDYTYGTSLHQLRTITKKPILLAEIGASEVGGNKPAWIRDLFDALTRPENSDVIGFSWFSETVTTISDGQRVTNDWRITSRSDSTRAFVKGITNPAAGFVDAPPVAAAVAAAPAPTPAATPAPTPTATTTPAPTPTPSPSPEPTTATVETAVPDPDPDPTPSPTP